MNFTDCVKMANETRTCFLATTEGDQPRVRALGMWYADETGFYFQTESVKALYHQLKQNNKVELCFNGKSGMLRVSGKTRFVDDPAALKKCLAERVFLQKFIKSPEDPLLVLFQVYTGEARFWTMANNMKEAEMETHRF